jgi:TolB-like protein/tetratricopeptide (TPR) repeat protein
MRMAILPFRQLRPDPDTEFLVFSLADAIASSLSGLESLVVRSSLAAGRFASDAPDLPAIATALDVTLVLAGTVMRNGDRVRVATQLLEAPRGTLLWTSTAETSIADLFQVSDELVHRIIESLALPLSVRESRVLNHDVPGSGRAYELYLRANGLGRYPDTWPNARDLYLEAIRADLDYAPAWARLGRVYRLMAKYGTDDEQQMTRLAEEAFRRALALNPELSLAHYLYAQLEMETARSLQALSRLLDRARERRADPQLFVGLVQACRYVGLLDASRAAHECAKRLDPAAKTSVAYTSLMAGDYARAVDEARISGEKPVEGFALAALQRFNEARSILEESLRTYAQNRTWATYLEMMLAFARGETAAAASLADVCLQLPFRDPEGLFALCLILVWSNDQRRAVHALRHTVDAGFACLPALIGDPAMHALADLPECERLRAQVKERHRQAQIAFDAAGGRELLRIPPDTGRHSAEFV